MAKPLKKSVLEDTSLVLLSPQAGDPGNGTNQPPKPPLFTNNPDVVDPIVALAYRYNPAFDFAVPAKDINT